ncbi:hypothetical protein ES703_82209 [subsurface metagenome]
MVPVPADLQAGRGVKFTQTPNGLVDRVDAAIHFFRDIRQTIFKQLFHMLGNQTRFKAHIFAALCHLDKQALPQVPCADTRRL